MFRRCRPDTARHAFQIQDPKRNRMPLFPLFKRPDGDLVHGESDVRRMIPYLMLGRNESVVYHELTIDMTKTKPWLVEYNKNHPKQPASLFHLCLWAAGRYLHLRPGMNRFISG